MSGAERRRPGLAGRAKAGPSGGRVLAPPGALARKWYRSASQNPNAAPVAVLIAMPLVMAMLGREWLYTPIGFLDPWYNIGFFMFYQDPTYLADHYKLQRLPWLLPGWILYHTVGPLAANFILHVGALVLSTVFVYLTLARLVSRQAAFVAAATLTIYIPFHGAGGWDYQAAGAAAYYAVTLYLVVRAAQADDPRGYLIAAGAAYAAAVFATIHLVNFLPVLAAFYLVARPRRTVPDIWRALRFGFYGFAGLTLALCLVDRAVGRGLFFFWPLLKIVIERVEDPSGQKLWWLPWSAFFHPPTSFLYLVFPAAMLLVSMLRLAAGVTRIGRLNPIRTLLLGQFVFVALLWILWQQLGQVALAPDYFAHVLIIPAFLALAGLLGGDVGGKARILPVLLASGLFLAFVPAAQGIFASVLAPEVAKLTEPGAVEALGAWAILILLLGAFMPWAAALTAVLAGLAGFSFAYLQIQPAWPHQFWQLKTYSERYWVSSGCALNEQTFREVIRLFGIFRSENPVIWQTWVWRGPGGVRTFESGCTMDLDFLRRTVTATGASNLGLPTDTRPSQISDQYIGYVVDGGMVVAMVQHEQDADGLVERFAAAGKKLTFVRRVTINLGQVPVLVLIYRSRNEK